MFLGGGVGAVTEKDALACVWGTAKSQVTSTGICRRNSITWSTDGGTLGGANVQARLGPIGVASNAAAVYVFDQQVVSPE
jgi:hypothetical protein